MWFSYICITSLGRTNAVILNTPRRVVILSSQWNIGKSVGSEEPQNDSIIFKLETDKAQRVGRSALAQSIVLSNVSLLRLLLAPPQSSRTIVPLLSHPWFVSGLGAALLSKVRHLSLEFMRSAGYGATE